MTVFSGLQLCCGNQVRFLIPKPDCQRQMSVWGCDVKGTAASRYEARRVDVSDRPIEAS